MTPASLTADLALADYFDAVVAAGASPKAAANWVTGEFSRLLNQHAAEGLRADRVALAPEGLAELIAASRAARCRPTNAKTVLARGFEQRRVAEGGRSRPRAEQVGDAARSAPRSRRCWPSSRAQVAEYRAGKPQLFGFLVGQVMKRTAGRADARLVNEELRRQLDAGR